MHPDSHQPDPAPGTIPESTTPEDQFDAWLDAFVAGTSTPVPETSASSSPEQAELAKAQLAANQFHGLVASADAVANDTTTISMETIWEDMLMTQHPASTAPAPIPLSLHRSAPKNTRPTRRLHSMNTMLSIAAVIALLIAAGSTAWFNRDHLGIPGGGGGGRDNPPPVQLSAIQTNDGRNIEIALDIPSKDDCTVEPLTVDQVVQRLQTRDIQPQPVDTKATAMASAATPVSDEGSPSQRQLGYLLEVPVYEELVQAQKVWLACSLYGTPFQRWALESNRMIQQEFQAAYMPVFDVDQIRTDLEKLVKGEDIGLFASPSLDGSPALPMVPSYVPGLYNRQYSDTNATLSIIWVRKDGTVLAPFGKTKADLQAYIDASALEQRLPNIWRFMKDPETGQWLLDEFSLGMG